MSSSSEASLVPEPEHIAGHTRTGEVARGPLLLETAYVPDDSIVTFTITAGVQLILEPVFWDEQLAAHDAYQAHSGGWTDPIMGGWRLGHPKLLEVPSRDLVMVGLRPPPPAS